MASLKNLPPFGTSIVEHEPQLGFERTKSVMTQGRRGFVILLSALGAALVAGPALAAGPELIASIRTARQRLRTLQAKFEQERTLGLLSTKVVSRGELTLVRPDRLRWQLHAPDAITWWITPAGLAYSSPRSQAQADRSAAGPMAAVLDDIFVILGGDPARLAPRYSLDAELQPDGSLRVLAVPKDPRVSGVVRSIEITLERDLISPRKIVLQEGSSDRLQIVFEDVRINQPVDPERMRPASASR